MTDSVECVQVVVRCRPLNEKEIKRGCQKVVSVNDASGEIIIGNTDCKNNCDTQSRDEAAFYSASKKQESGQYASKMFTFDKAFGEQSMQETIYEQTARDIVDSVMNGYNGTIFAYGQTGTGKTYTMVGIYDDAITQGIIPRAFKHIFNEINNSNKTADSFLVCCTFIEIYNDSIKDLLSANSGNCNLPELELREHPKKGVYVKDLSYKEAKTEQELETYFLRGNDLRHVAETAMNRDSSRSHSVFTIIIESVFCDANGGDSAAAKENIRVGKLHLVDLAGSERQSKTQAKGLRFTEAININLSLSALGNVINSLTSNKSTHIPYRDSKLTRILQDSLGGNSKTVMIANICCSDYNYEETLSTLRFANRAKDIKNKPHINQDPKDELLQQYKSQIEELRKRLANKQSTNGRMDDENEQVIPKIIIQKIHKIGISKERVRRMSALQEKEEEKLKKKYEKEKREWKKETKCYLTKKMKTEKKLKYIQQEILLKKQMKKENIKKKLLDIEQKLVDGEKMINYAQKQEEELISKKQKLFEIKNKEERLRKDYQEKHEKHVSLKKKYNSHSDELKDKKKKLIKLYGKYKALSHNIENVQSSFQSKREEYLNIIRILNRKMQLKNTMIEYFIHPNQLQQLYESNRIALTDNEENDGDDDIEKIYKIKKLDLQQISNTVKRPMSCKHIKRIRPVTEWNRMQCVLLQNESARYRYQNTIQLQLDLPQRTTQHYYQQTHPSLYDE